MRQVAETVQARLKDVYRTEIVPKLIEEFGYGNLMAVPRIKKICLNMGRPCLQPG